MRVRTPVRSTFATVAVVLGCAGSTPPASQAERLRDDRLSEIHYACEIADDLATLAVTACFRGVPPPRLVSGVVDGERMLQSAVRVPEDGEASGAEPLPHDETGIDLRGLGRDACVRYVLDLGAAESMIGGARHVTGAVVSNPAAWLWRPPTGASALRATARFEHGPGVDVAVPWPADGNVSVLDGSVFGFQSHAVFGTFERERVDVAGATFDVIVLRGLAPETRALVGEWIASAARMVARVGGRLPADRVQVVVAPIGAGGDPVRFGHLTRGGGASVTLLVSSDATRDALLSDWTLPHELSHLWLPFVERRSAWLSEGFATYYQEVVRARSGTISQVTAWRRLAEGAALAQDDVRTLEEASARVFETYDFPRVYWGGAAIALLADVEIRRRSGGARTLDDVVSELQACCARGARAWTLGEVVERFDALAGTPVLSDLVARYVAAPNDADLDAIYPRLGIVRHAEGYALDPRAPEAWIREGIMGARATDARRTEPRVVTSTIAGAGRPWHRLAR